MDNQLWPYTMLSSDLSQEHSLIGNALRLVCRTLNTDACALWLNEAEGPSDQVLMFQAGKCFCVSSEDGVFESLRSFGAMDLSCREACRFGRFYWGKDPAKFPEQGREAFAVFCELLYTDYMVGFFDSPAPVALEVKDVVMNYGSGKNSPNVLDGVSFLVHKGQLTVLMGVSGCGKSTALNVMGGLLKPVSGSVLYKGTDVCGYNKRQMNDYRRNSIGFIFQNYNLITDLTVGENVEIARSLADDPADAAGVLESVGVEQYAKEYPYHLSGGEQQRVCIARALVKNADILLCDEPTGALDTVNSKNIMTILQKKAKEKDSAVVVVTHNPDFEALADHYIEMRNGSILLDEYRPFPYSAEEYL